MSKLTVWKWTSDWSAAKKYGAFVFTSNVDGHFQKARFPDNRVLECHGSIHLLQCARPCSSDVWAADDLHPEIDEERCVLTSTEHCSYVAEGRERNIDHGRGGHGGRFRL